MAITKKTDQVPNALANGSAEVERLATLVRDLQEERVRMRQALAKAEMERDRYRQAYLDQARAAGAFEDLDIPTLEAISAGPVELIE